MKKIDWKKQAVKSLKIALAAAIAIAFIVEGFKPAYIIVTFH